MGREEETMGGMKGRAIDAMRRKEFREMGAGGEVE
jgi:hypothetical protein